MNYIVTICDKKYEVSIDGEVTRVKVNGREIRVDHRNLRGKLQSILVDNLRHEFEMIRVNGGFDVWHGSGMIHADVVDEKTDRVLKLMGAAGASVKASSLRAPMPGLILKVEVEVGQHVKKGDGLIVIEAMKMENELRAHNPATIKEIKVKPGQAVEKNQELIIFA
jgi:pyruvate carboxylase subunit B